MSMLFCCCAGEEGRRDAVEFSAPTAEDTSFGMLNDLKSPKSASDEPKKSENLGPFKAATNDSQRSDSNEKYLQEDRNDFNALEEKSSPRDTDEIRKGKIWKPPEKATLSMPELTKEVQVGTKCRRTSTPFQTEISEGAYLIYDKETSAIACQWSKTPIMSALAWMKPSVQVPKHVYNVNGGRNVYFNSTRDKDAYKYFQGWTHFVKMSRKYGGKIMLLDGFNANEAPLIHFLVLEPILEGDKNLVGKYKVALWEEPFLLYDMKNIKAVSIVRSSSTLIPVGEVMDGEIFVKRGDGEGSGVFLEALVKK